MGIKSFIETSLTDWDGKVSAVVFLGGCDFRCPYCHNWQLVEDSDATEDLDLGKIVNYVKSSSEWLDGVVLTGGEPTFYPDIIELAETFKALGMEVKIDTNGSNPNVLHELIHKDLIDYIAMDVKNSFEKYAETSGATVDIDNIERSIGLVKDFQQYEFRTTVVPGLVTEEDIEKICSYIKDARRFVLQRFHPENVINKEFSEISPQTDEEMEHLTQFCSKYVPTTWRG
ncbi:MAG: anaerobic ribonucleoside-triphosphate reductase activating protein [Candidatus Methanofastidiosia archaeon]